MAGASISAYLNQWIQPDPIVSDPYTPADWNRYTYVRNNPINFVDPSGLRVCIEGACLDPLENYNLTGWLIRTMNANATSAEVARIRGLVDLAGNVIPDAIRAVNEALVEKGFDIDLLCIYSRLLEDPYRAQAYSSWEGLVAPRHRWDFKYKILLELGDSIRLCLSSSDCRWYDSDVVGNIHYGYVGRAAGFMPQELYLGGGMAQQQGEDPGSGRWWSYFDDPLDTNAIGLGIELYRRSKRVSPESFRFTLANYPSKLREGKPPSPLEYVAPYGIEPGFGPRFPVTYFDYPDGG
jgi:hypothetical protein